MERVNKGGRSEPQGALDLTLTRGEMGVRYIGNLATTLPVCCAGGALCRLMDG